MSEMILDAQILDELKAPLDRNMVSSSLIRSVPIENQTGLFRAHFRPEVLRQLDGETLRQLMHGRSNAESKCLAYWLEFKNDEEFGGNQFGGIGGGSALKFGLYQRGSDSVWITGSPNQQRVLVLDEAIAIARRQRDELLAGDEVLAALDPRESSDETYARLQTAMS